MSLQEALVDAADGKFTTEQVAAIVATVLANYKDGKSAPGLRRAIDTWLWHKSCEQR